MARRAAGALVVVLIAAPVVLSALLLGGEQGAVAATGSDLRRSQSAAGITISGMKPQWATPGSTITVSGTVRNTTGQPASHLTVQLLGSSTPVASVAELQQDASQAASPATTTLPGASWQTSGRLAPGGTAPWTIRIPARALGMTAFGVYPLAARLQSGLGSVLASSTTYLPYEPAKKGPYASSRRPPAKISWLWPLIDRPLLNQPWQDNCSGPQASALAQSLSEGRLSQLVRIGATTQTQGHSLGDAASITWVVDPALLVNARALAGCHIAQPRWARTASAWLAELRSATAGRPLAVTPYGDPNVAALIAVGHGADVRRSFQLGRALAGQILHRDLSPASPGGTSTTLATAAGIGWPTAGVPGYTTLENLANVNGVGTLILTSAAFPAAQRSVLRTANGGGGYITALLASQALTQLLTTAGNGSAFTTGQAFLAETALLAQQVPAQPIVVAPPHRFDPPASLPAELLTDTAAAPWLSPVSLTSLTTARTVSTVLTRQWPSGSPGQSPLTGRSELRQLRVLDREIAQLESIRARPDQSLYLAVSTVESSAWQGGTKGIAAAMLETLADRISAEQQAVKIIAEKRITLGGLKGGVPVSIDNPLPFPVKVQLLLQYNQASGVKIAAEPASLITVPAHTAQTVRLHVQAAEVGSTTVTLQLASPAGALLSGPQRMTIQATQVGVLGMIICAAALGVFLIASAARAVRRGQPVTGADEPQAGQPGGDHAADAGMEAAEPDTVVAERTELGAGKPGP